MPDKGKIQDEGHQDHESCRGGGCRGSGGESRRGCDSRIEDRKNYIIRKSTNLSKEAHIIAANVDQAMLGGDGKPSVTSTVFIDRFLASVEAYRIPAVLVFNKIDLYDEDDLMMLGALTRVYLDAGYECLHVSSLTGEGDGRRAGGTKR